jgi:hypothetical protein
MAGDLMSGDLVRHEEFGFGRVEHAAGFGESQNCRVYFPRGERVTWCKRSALERLTAETVAAYELVKLAVRDLREEESPAVEMADRWEGGEVVIQPGDPDLASKSVPIEAFFHKFVMIRDRLRVMEQQINAHKSLSDADKVSLQQYITRIYGSVTTFNMLFKSTEDRFVGQKGNK